MSTATPHLAPVPKTLREKLKWARNQAGLSHDAVAAKAGTSRQYLIQLEKGKHTPSDSMLERIADAVGQPLEFFIGSPSERLAAKQKARLAAALQPLVDGLAEELLSLVRDLGDKP